jgi:hypothetical protein
LGRKGGGKTGRATALTFSHREITKIKELTTDDTDDTDKETRQIKAKPAYFQHSFSFSLFFRVVREVSGLILFLSFCISRY